MGVEKKIITAGDGETIPKSGDMLTMHYTGTLAGYAKIFDSSVSRGKPFQFVIGIGQVIRGWDEGVMQMSLGEKAILHISSDYGYGEEGAPGAIPPNADLNFEVELLAIGDKKAPGFTGSSASSSSSWCTLL
jgi:FK506-binding protein 1